MTHYDAMFDHVGGTKNKNVMGLNREMPVIWVYKSGRGIDASCLKIIGSW